jgi:type III pantothenate kinase
MVGVAADFSRWSDMTVLDAVVDIGNSRIKLCRCDANGLVLPVRAFQRIDDGSRSAILGDWAFTSPKVWAVASTVPEARAEFRNWATARGDRAIEIDSPAKIPIRMAVDEPNRVGIDRLLNAFAASALVKAGQPAIIIDAGSAVTVDLLDESARFAGGTIFPGVRLMALALHTHTAQLPLVETLGPLPGGPPGKNTEDAMRLGIIHAVAGGIDAVVRETAASCSIAPRLFLVGGDMSPQLAGLLQCRHAFRSEFRPALTLEGIFRAASQLP